MAAQSEWGKRIEDKGYIPIQVCLLPETAQRLIAIQKLRGFKRRTDAVKEAIADYLLKHETGGNK
jgi:hypothetical protein